MSATASDARLAATRDGGVSGLVRRYVLGPLRLALELARPGKDRHRALARLAALRVNLTWRLRRPFLRRGGRRRELVAISLVDHFGDLVAAEPLLRAARRRHPDAYVVWITRPRWRALLAPHPELDAVVPVPCVTAAMFLRRARAFDRLYDLQVPGRACDVCYWPYERPGEPHGITAANYYGHGNLLGIFSRLADLPVDDEAPHLAPDAASTAAIDRLGLPERFVAIHAESRQAVRNWREARWDELVGRLCDEAGIDVVEVGLESRRRSLSPRFRSLAGVLSPSGTAEVIRRARLFIGVDSGPAHVANAVGTPGVVLLGRYRSYTSYMPFSGRYREGARAEILQAEGPAADIAVQEVMEAARRLLPAEPGRARVSVVIPTYEHGGLVGETLASVFGQTHPPFEVIVIDDGSTDGTTSVLAPYVADGRIRYVRQENAGQGAARNRGLALARGDYVAFLDDDDLWPPDALERQVATLRERRGAILSYGAHETLRPDGGRVQQAYDDHPEGWCASAFLSRNWIHSPGQTLIERAALERVGGFDETFAGSDDWDLYLRLARTGAFARTPGTTLLYRDHDANASRDAVAHARDHLRVVRRHYRNRPVEAALHLRRSSSYYAPQLERSAAVARSAGDHRGALRAFRYALLFRPELLARPAFLASLGASLCGLPSLGWRSADRSRRGRV